MVSSKQPVSDFPYDFQTKVSILVLCGVHRETKMVALALRDSRAVGNFLFHWGIAARNAVEARRALIVLKDIMPSWSLALSLEVLMVVI